MSGEEEYRDTGASVVASALAGQLGTDPSVLAMGQIDMRRLTVIKERDMMFIMYATLRSRKSRAWRMILDAYLNAKVSVGGRGRRDIIRMEGVSRGGIANVDTEIQSPNWVGRNLTDRKWRDKAEAEQDKI